MKLLKLSQKRKLFVKFVSSILISIIITMILPLVFFFNFLSLNISSDLLLRIRDLTIISVILGGFTVIFNVSKYMLNPLSRANLIVNIGTELLYTIYFYLWSQFWVIKIDIEDFSLTLDLSILSLFIYVVPIMIMVRSIYRYFINYKKAFSNAIILKVIKDRNFNSKNVIRKYLGRNLNSEFKTEILQDLSKKIDDLEAKMLIKKQKKYLLIKKGKDLLNWFEEKRNSKLRAIIKPEYTTLGEAYPLQVWTEEDLEKLKFENYHRGKKNE